jgi:hypothetical protein
MGIPAAGLDEAEDDLMLGTVHLCSGYHYHFKGKFEKALGFI